MAQGKSAYREDLTGFGGFTFANNSADKGGEQVGANHEIDENAPVFRVPKTGTTDDSGAEVIFLTTGIPTFV